MEDHLRIAKASVFTPVWARAALNVVVQDERPWADEWTRKLCWPGAAGRGSWRWA